MLGVQTKKTADVQRFNNHRGPGGSRTLVQTRKPYAFYMLISAFGFRAYARPEPPTYTLVPKISFQSRNETKTISEFAAPLNQTLRNKSF